MTSTNKRTIWLDIDNCIVDWLRGFSNYLFDVHQITFHPHEATYYEYFSDNYRKEFDEFYHSTDVYGTYVHLFPDAEEFVNKLREKYTVKFITNTYPTPECILDKAYYLGKALDVLPSSIITETRKYLHMTKNDVLVDDKPWNCYQHSSINKGLSILFNYNASHQYCDWRKAREFSYLLPLKYATSYRQVLETIEDY